MRDSDSDSDTVLRDVVSTWPGRIYLAALLVVTASIYQFTARIDPSASAEAGSMAVFVGMLAVIVGFTGVMYALPRMHLLWVLWRNVSGAVSVFVVAFFWMLITGVDTATGIYQSPSLRVFLSMIFVLSLAEIIGILVLAARLLVDSGGNGQSPEEQVLGDDLDL